VVACLVLQAAVALPVEAAKHPLQSKWESQAVRQVRQGPGLRWNGGFHSSASQCNRRLVASLPAQPLSASPAFPVSTITGGRLVLPLSREPHRYSGRSPPVSL